MPADALWHEHKLHGGQRVTPAELSDGELSAMVAEKWAGWTAMRYVQEGHFYLIPGNAVDQIAWRGSSWRQGRGDAKERRVLSDSFSMYRELVIPSFATSADAVLPLLAKGLMAVSIYWRDGEWQVYMADTPTSATCVIGKATTLPRAACLALLAAHQEGGT